MSRYICSQASAYCCLKGLERLSLGMEQNQDGNSTVASITTGVPDTYAFVNGCCTSLSCTV